MTLEDGIADVVGKAIRGRGLVVADVARACSLSERELEGDMDGSALRRVADFLGLDGDALAGLEMYEPKPREMAGVSRILMPFREWTVNAWLIERCGHRILFDSGWGESDLVERIDCSDLSCVFITHGHVDHVGGIGALMKKGTRVIREEEALASGLFEFGDIRIRVVDLSGHCSPAVGYVVSGDDADLLVAGDAIFAGSVGGCKTVDSFAQAFRSMKVAFEGLCDDALILPGHGPVTSLGEERASNPFRLLFS